MENKKISKNELDIEIKDLLWEVVRRWRVLVIMAIICGIGLGMYQYRIDSSKTDVVVVTKSKEELEKSMSVQDVSEVTGAVALLNQLKQKSEYMDQSTLMQMNPYEENAVLLQYIVLSDDKNQESLIAAYQNYLEEGYLAQKLAGEDALYLAELISVVKDSQSLYVYSDNTNESIQIPVTEEKKGDCLSVKISGVDESAAIALADEVKKVLEEYADVLKREVGNHQLKLIEEMSCVIVDQDLAELQNRNATAIKVISNNIDKMKNEMTSDQVKLYTYRVTGTSQSTNQGTTTTSLPKHASLSVKHVAIGVILGIVLGCVIVLLQYLFSARLRCAEELKTLYQVKVLGELENPNKKKAVFSGIDKLFEKIRYANVKNLSYENALQMICASITIDCKSHACDKVILTGSMLEDMPEQIMDELKKRCGEKGVIVETTNAIVYDAEALEATVKCGNVMFLEQKRHSLYDELYKEFALCKEHGVHISGVVVVGE